MASGVSTPRKHAAHGARERCTPRARTARTASARCGRTERRPPAASPPTRRQRRQRPVAHRHGLALRAQAPRPRPAPSPAAQRTDAPEGRPGGRTDALARGESTASDGRRGRRGSRGRSGSCRSGGAGTEQRRGSAVAGRGRRRRRRRHDDARVAEEPDQVGNVASRAWLGQWRSDPRPRRAAASRAAAERRPLRAGDLHQVHARARSRRRAARVSRGARYRGGRARPRPRNGDDRGVGRAAEKHAPGAAPTIALGVYATVTLGAGKGVERRRRERARRSSCARRRALRAKSPPT